MYYQLEESYEQVLDLLNHGETAQAQKTAQEMIERDSACYYAWGVYGLTCIRSGEEKNAETALRKAIALQRDYAPAYYELAKIVRSSNPEEAEYLAEEAVELYPCPEHQALAATFH